MGRAPAAFESVAPEVYAMDLDVTALQTELALNGMLRIAAANNWANARTVRHERRLVEAGGDPFDLIEHLSDQGVEQAKLDAILDEFAANERYIEYLYGDARLLVQAYEETETPFFTFTRGNHPTQIAKLRASGLINYPYLITDDPDKGSAIGHMVQNDGTYAVRVSVGLDGEEKLLRGRSMYLIEDKPLALQWLPADCSGALIIRTKALRKSQQGTVPARIPVLSDLSEVTERIRRNAAERR